MVWVGLEPDWVGPEGCGEGRGGRARAFVLRVPRAAAGPEWGPGVGVERRGGAPPEPGGDAGDNL